MRWYAILLASVVGPGSGCRCCHWLRMPLLGPGVERLSVGASRGLLGGLGVIPAPPSKPAAACGENYQQRQQHSTPALTDRVFRCEGDTAEQPIDTQYA